MAKKQDKKAKSGKGDAQQSSRAAEVSRKVAKRGAREARKAFRRFWSLVADTTKTLFGVGQRRVNRRNNRTTIGRYINDIITLAETTHIAGLKVDLSKVLVEPRFLAAPDIEEPVAEDEAILEVFYVIPRMPDLPEILAPYNLPSYRIPQLAVGNRRLILVGTQGSGRTTALMAIALWALRELQFEEPEDPVKQKIREQLEELSEAERKKLEEEEQRQLENARQQLETAIERGDIDKPKVTSAAEAEAVDEMEEEPPPPFDTLIPLYIHLGDLNITAREFGEEVDPAEPLMRALQRSVSTLSARTMPRMIYERLESNRALILMDGYDELPPTERKRVQAWLQGFLAQYGKNFIILTGPAKGYGAFMQHGFTPLFMKPWNQNEIDDYVNKWAEAWPDITGTRRQPGEEVSESQRKRAAVDNYALTPAELTLKVWAMFSDDSAGYQISDWVKVFINTFLPDKYPYIEVQPFLSNAAALQTDLGFMTRQGIEVLFQQQEKTGETVISQEALAELDQDGDGVADEDADDEDVDNEDDAAAARARLLQELIFAGLLRRYRGGRYRFRHSLFSDYLASVTLTNLPENDPATLYEIAQKPNWQRPLMFAAQHTNLDDVARMKFMQPPDFLYSDLIEMARWLAYIETPPAWRGELLKQLGNAFVHPQQYVTNRERIAAALVSTRDYEGALNIFEYGLGSDDIDVRRLSILGIGALGQHGRRLGDKLIDLINDPTQYQDVHVAAAHALAALWTEPAKIAMVNALLDGEERLQQAVAEAFAAKPKDGYLTLYDAVEHEDMRVRRAVLFGLRRVETDWAQRLVYQRYLQENEWYARVVAQDGFMQFFIGLEGPPPPPNTVDVEWIRDWTEYMGMRMPEGKASNNTLLAMMEDDDINIRTLTTLIAGQIGVFDATVPLYDKLADPDPIVREAAHKALVEMQIKLGERLPNPM